jgi:hypothetical protein
MARCKGFLRQGVAEAAAYSGDEQGFSADHDNLHQSGCVAMVAIAVLTTYAGLSSSIAYSYHS